MSFISKFKITGLVVSLILSAMVFKFTYDHQKSLWEKEFINEAEKTTLTFKNKIEINERVLFDILSFHGASQQVDREGFKAFVSPLLARYKFIQALEWIPRVSHNQRIQFENRAKEESVANFQFTERLKQGTMIPAGSRHEYFPVYFVEPFIGNEMALGFDLASNPKRLESIKESGNSGKTIATAKILLVQEEKVPPGVLIFAPFYGSPETPQTIEGRKEKLEGFVLGVYHLRNMIEEFIFPGLEKGMNLSVFEGKEFSEQNRIFGEYKSDSLLNVKEELDFSGRNWTLVLQADANFQNGIKTNTSFAFAGATIFLSLLIAIIFELNISKTRKIKKEVHRQTHQLLENRARVKAIVDHAIDGIITIDEKGSIESFNPAAERLFGYKPSEVMGRNVNMLMPEPYSSEHDQYLKNYMETGISKIIGIGREVVGLRKDGSTFPLDLGISEMYQGETRMFTGIVRDITERKEAEEKLDRTTRTLEMILNSAGEGIYGLDLEGKTTFANPAAMEMLGYSQEELVGQPQHALIHHSRPDGSPYPREECHIYAAFRDGKVHRESEEVFWRKDGTPLAVEYVSTPTRENGELSGAVVIFKDISQRRRTDRIIQDHLKDLKRANEMLFRSNKELDDFAYIVSHDLKEPLRGIYNYAGFINEDFHDKLDEEGKSKLETLQRLSKRMEALINCIMYFSRLGRNDPLFEPIDLNRVISESLENMQSLATETKTEFHVHENFPKVLGNPTRLIEVFQNLIANAIKYNDKPEKRIEIGYLLNGNTNNENEISKPGPDKSPGDSSTSPVFYVKDNGIGILDKHYDSVFRIFKRLNGRNKYSEGTGAGTTIVKKIIEQHNGNIWLESKVGEGTTFYFSLGGKEGNGT